MDALGHVFKRGAITIMILTYQCYYCPFKPDDESQYIKHGVKYHLYLPVFPGEADLAKHGLAPQGKPWEKYNITVEEADRRLRAWAEKGSKGSNRHQNNNNSKKEVK